MMAYEDLELLMAFVTKLVTAAVTLFLAVLKPDSPLYWPYLASFLVLGLGWGLVRHGGALAAAWGHFMGLRIWWHPSARTDYAYYLVNGLFFPLVVGPALLGTAEIATALRAVLPRMEHADAWWHLPVFTGLIFMVRDLGRYLAHSALHDIPVLWPFHKPHHSAEVLTPFTSFRVHPIDLMVMHWVPAVLTGVVSGLWIAFVATDATYWTVAQVHVALYALSFINNLRHSHVQLGFGPVLGRLVVSPAHHMVHHSDAPRHWGRNRASELALWDWMFGTLWLPRPDEDLRFGLGDEAEQARYRTLWQLYFSPLADVAGMLRRRAAAGQ